MAKAHANTAPAPLASANAAPPPSHVARHSFLTDIAIAAAFVLATVATRWPVRSQWAFNWDAVNFALAVRDYDVRLHHPHPPGYPLFVAMGRLFATVAPDVNAALVAVAMLLSAGAVAALYWLGRTLYDRATGVVAALFLLGSVTFWTNGAVALAYPSLALFGTLVALFAWKLRSSRFHVPSSKWERRNASADSSPHPVDRTWNLELGTWNSILLSAAYALGGGFRPDLLLFLAPLWLWGHGRAGWRLRFTGAAVAAVIVLAWAVPMIALSGGPGEYLKVLRAYTADDVLRRYSVAENGPRALLVNLRDLLTYTGYALYALALPVTGAAVWLLLRIRRWRQPRVALFALWVSPVLLFYAWVHIGDPGYVSSFVPALLLLAAHFVMKVTSNTYRVTSGAYPARGRTPYASQYLVPVTCYLLLVAVLATNAGIFLTRPLALTAPGITRQDRTVAGKIAFVRAHANPADTVLVSYESYRHWLFYLPEYRTQFVDVTYGTEADRTLTLPPGVTRVVLMDDTLLRAVQGATSAEAATVERDRVGVLTAPPSPLRFTPVASPLGRPGG